MARDEAEIERLDVRPPASWRPRPASARDACTSERTERSRLRPHRRRLVRRHGHRRNADVASRVPSSTAVTRPSRMLFSPMKSAVKRRRGVLVEFARTVPASTTSPPETMARRSPTLIASSWLCVTWTNVMLQPLLKLLEPEAHVLAQLGVECGERLVEQDDVALQDQRAGELHALLLPAGQLEHPPVAVASTVPPPPSMSVDAAGDLLAWRPPFNLQPVADIVRHLHVREQREGLEHHGRRPAVGRKVRDGLAVDEDVPGASASETRR